MAVTTHVEVEVRDLVTSTNDLLKDQVTRADTDVLAALVARRQSAGRGRGGNRWISPEGGVYLSVAMPIHEQDTLPMVGPAVGLAVVDWLSRRHGLTARLKWPNDLLVSGRKLVGLLLEAEWSRSARLHLIVGLGMNVLTVPTDLGPGAMPPTSLSRELGTMDLDPVALAVELVQEVLEARSAAAADPGRVREGVQRVLGTIGQEVRVDLPGGRVITGVATGLGPSMELLVETGEGLLEVTAGDVLHLRAVGTSPRNGSREP